MKALLKTAGLFILFLAAMSISIGNRPIFSHIYDVISPVTKSAQNSTEEFFSRSLSSTQAYSKKLFENSVPNVKDAVGSKLASQKKWERGTPAEDITQGEKAQLEDLIKNH